MDTQALRDPDPIAPLRSLLCRITVLRGKEHGVSVVMAFMSPHVKGKTSEEERQQRVGLQEVELRRQRLAKL